MGDGIDLKAIFNEVNQIAKLASTSVAGTLAEHANAIPKDTTTSDLTWEGKKKRLSVPFRWTSKLSDWGIASETNVAIICGWEWGGTYKDKGQFLANLRLGFTVESIGLGQSFDIEGSFDDPTPIGDDPIASLGGTLTLKHNYVGMLMESYTITFEARGDGNGTATKA